ncbi:MAG: Rieske 2Fe-2S domain-containing protein [Rhodospirillaceae bacterium]|jgi:5,5'-dehydrodivanillate O-demethylase oxygenase subunit|nr:Rieske 2Fe-2S domain-containing protein [Rhodospirillaceae bacterium]MBT5458144.1 Rieske 2Fe-2S domain-containing protein [Rhodospirillaceae bacterium]
MAQDREDTGSSKDFALLSQTAHGTDMGNLLRQFWQPVALSAQAEPGKAVAIRMFGEELAFYRGEGGEAHLVANQCAHRCTSLHTGWVEGDDIRCVYHGWKYDGTGQCREIPSESDDLAATVRIAGYPVHEYGGLVFAYLGEGDAPAFDLPRKDCFEESGRLLFARQQFWPCHWLQQVENSLDALHVSFVHQKGKIGHFGEAVTPAIPDLDYFETDAGIRQVATRSANNVRVSDWTFPNNNHILIPSAFRDGPWVDLGIWIVPVDDEMTSRFQLYAVPSVSPEADQRMRDHFDAYRSYTPIDHHGELLHDQIFPEEVFLELTNAQDYVAAVGQGKIVNRSQERLVKSDLGVALVRRLLFREMAARRSGKEPKTWTRLTEEIELQTEEVQKSLQV